MSQSSSQAEAFELESTRQWVAKDDSDGLPLPGDDGASEPRRSCECFVAGVYVPTPMVVPSSREGLVIADSGVGVRAASNASAGPAAAGAEKRDGEAERLDCGLRASESHGLAEPYTMATATAIAI